MCTTHRFFRGGFPRFSVYHRKCDDLPSRWSIARLVFARECGPLSRSSKPSRATPGSAGIDDLATPGDHYSVHALVMKDHVDPATPYLVVKQADVLLVHAVFSFTRSGEGLGQTLGTQVRNECTLERREGFTSLSQTGHLGPQKPPTRGNVIPDIFLADKLQLQKFHQ